MSSQRTYKKLGEVANIYQPKTIAASALVEDGQYPVYGANGVIGRYNEYNHDGAELLVGCRGSCGSVSISTPHSWINGNAMVIHPKDEFRKEISSKYLYYVLKGIDYSKVITGGTIPQITRTKLSPVLVHIPSVNEQDTVVKELDSIHSIISAKNMQMEELDALAQAIFYDSFGDPLENPKGWNVLKLSDVVDEQCKMSYGIVQPGDDIEGGVPVVRPVDFKDSVYIKKDGLKRTLPSISESYKRTILRGDEILICVRGTTGTMGLATPDLKGCNVTRGIVPLYFKNGMNKWFMYEYLKSDFAQNIIAEYTYGATLKQINIGALRNIPVIVPPLDLQQSFAVKIQAIEAQKQTLRQSIAEFESLLAQRMDVHFG